MRKVTIDTNALLRLFLDDVPHQVLEVQKLLVWAKNGKLEIIIPQIIVFEIVFALSKFYKLPKREIIPILRSLLAFPGVKIQNKKLFEESTILYSDVNLSLVDCFLIQYSKNKNFDIFTFDKKLNKLFDKR